MIDLESNLEQRRLPGTVPPDDADNLACSTSNDTSLQRLELFWGGSCDETGGTVPSPN